MFMNNHGCTVMAIPHMTLGFGSGVAFWESLRNNHDKVLYQEKFEGTRSQYNGQNNKEKTMIYKIPYRKPKTEQDKSHQILGINSGAQEGLAVPAPPMSRRSDDHIGIVINTKKQLFYRGSSKEHSSQVYFKTFHCFQRIILK